MKQAPVVLEEYDEQWATKFEEEKRFLLGLVSEWNYGGVMHVGSTAVPGMVAKPIIDIMFGVKSLESSRPAIDVLRNNGYEYWPYKAGVMHWFCKPSDAFRTHHLHLIPYGSALWQERLRFRDLLREDRKIAGDYADLKWNLAVKYRDDREAYTQHKWPFIDQVLQRELKC